MGYITKTRNLGNTSIETIAREGGRKTCVRCNFTYRAYSGKIHNIHGKWLCYRCVDPKDYGG